MKTKDQTRWLASMLPCSNLKTCLVVPLIGNDSLSTIHQITEFKKECFNHATQSVHI